MDPETPSARAFVFTEEFRPNGPGPFESHNQAVRDARFKLVRTKSDALYDLEGRYLEGPDLLREGREPLSPEAADALERLVAELDRGRSRSRLRASVRRERHGRHRSDASAARWSWCDNSVRIRGGSPVRRY